MRQGQHAGHLLTQQLLIHGVDTVFQLPGESFLAALDGFVDLPQIRLVTCRQEGGVAMAAEAYGKLTGRPGIAFVTRAPGACNASSGVHVAFQDSTPMILFVGQINSRTRDREPFQDMDYRAMFAPLAKWVTEIDHADRIPELVSQAFHKATSGRPGPVVIALPEDMLSGPMPAQPAVPARRYQPAQADASPAQAQAVRSALAAAERPLVIVGGSLWSDATGRALAGWAERNGLPVAASMRCQSHIDNFSPAYAGELGIGANPALLDRVRASDLLLVIGARMGEMTSQNWTLLGIPTPGQRLIHVYADGNELGRIYQPDLPILAAPPAFVAQLVQQDLPARDPQPAAQAHQAYLDWIEPRPSAGALRMEQVIGQMSARLDPDAIIATGAGNYTGWPQRYHRFRQHLTQLACTSGSMGYSIPAALAAKVVHPTRQVIAFAGDGCFQMNSQELATIAEEQLGLVILLVNNGQYGTIRMHQARAYPGRISGTQLRNPDFAALARAHGLAGATIEATAQFAPAFEAALAAAGQGQASLLDLRIDPDVLSTSLLTSQVERAN